MNWRQCTCSQESEGDCLQTSFWDIDQSWQLNGSHTLAKSSENEQEKDGSTICQCGKGTLDCLIHPSTPEKWIASMRDSLARTLVSLESRQAYLREPDQVFTEKSCVLLTRYDQSIYSWRMSQQSFLTDSEPFSETWPRWGMTQDGAAYAHPMSERRITETDGSQWPTPRANSAMAATITPENSWNKDRFPNLETVVGRKMFPTPVSIDSGTWRFNTSIGSNKPRPTLAMMAKRNLWPPPTAHNAKSESERNTPTLAAQVGGKLNPDWVGWLMGFPTGFTGLKDSETPKSRSKQQSRGNYSEANK